MSKQINIVAVAVFFVFLLFSSVFCQESITITTYYPSPYGSYNELRANQMSIGSSYASSSLSDGNFIVSGNVGIGIASPSSYKLQLSTDSAAKPTSNTWTISSDRRLKKNIKPLKGALGKMTKLHGVTYQWKEPGKFGNMTSAYMGLIGQEVEEVFPEWVGTDKDGYKNLTVSGFEALTAESIRELKAENNALKAKNVELEIRIKKLEKKLKL